MRPTWDQFFMQAARHAATRATCDMLPSGAVLVRDNRQLALGYTASPINAPHCTDLVCVACGDRYDPTEPQQVMAPRKHGPRGGSCVWTGATERPMVGGPCYNPSCPTGKLASGHRLVRRVGADGTILAEACEEAVHAELNALLNAAALGVSTSGAVLYATHLPCWTCAQAIINAGVASVVYAARRGPDPSETLLQRYLPESLVQFPGDAARREE